MLSIARVIRVADFEQMLLERIEVRLGEPDAQGNGMVGWCYADEGPSDGRAEERFLDLEGLVHGIAATWKSPGISYEKDKGE